MRERVSEVKRDWKYYLAIMGKLREKTIRWKNFVFTPRGADRDTHSIKHSDEGFLHLCERLYDGDYLREWDIYNSRFKPGDGGRNAAFDWTGFREAMQRYEAKNPQPPSVLCCSPRKPLSTGGRKSPDSRLP